MRLGDEREGPCYAAAATFKSKIVRSKTRQTQVAGFAVVLTCNHLSRQRAQKNLMTKNQRGAEKEVSSDAFMHGAKQYRNAGDVLLGARESIKDSLDPVYMLYFHAAELALKAFLIFRGKKTGHLKKKEFGHNLETLHREAISCGLNPEPTERLDLQNVMHLLHSGNQGEAFRYFSWDSRSIPDIEWCRNVVSLLVSLVEKRIGYVDDESGPPVKADLVWGQPISKKQ